MNPEDGVTFISGNTKSFTIPKPKTKDYYIVNHHLKGVTFHSKRGHCNIYASNETLTIMSYELHCIEYLTKQK